MCLHEILRSPQHSVKDTRHEQLLLPYLHIIILDWGNTNKQQALVYDGLLMSVLAVCSWYVFPFRPKHPHLRA